MTWRKKVTRFLSQKNQELNNNFGLTIFEVIKAKVIYFFDFILGNFLVRTLQYFKNISICFCPKNHTSPSAKKGGMAVPC